MKILDSLTEISDVEKEYISKHVARQSKRIATAFSITAMTNLRLTGFADKVGMSKSEIVQRLIEGFLDHEDYHLDLLDKAFQNDIMLETYKRIENICNPKMKDCGGVVIGNTATLDMPKASDVELFEIEEIDPVQAYREMQGDLSQK